MKPERWVIIEDVNSFINWWSWRGIDNVEFSDDDAKDILRRYDMTLEELRQLHQRIKLYETIWKARK